MQLNVVLSCPTFGTTEETVPNSDTIEVPITVQINGRFGEVDPLTVEDAQLVLPKLAYVFEALVKEHHARKAAQLQRLALMQQAQAQAEAGRGIVKTAGVLEEINERFADGGAVAVMDSAVTEVTATDSESEAHGGDSRDEASNAE